jgi:protease-4
MDQLTSKWSFKGFLTSSARILVGVTIVLVWVAFAIGGYILYEEMNYDYSSSGGDTEEDVATESEEDCNVAGIELNGNIVTYISPANFDDNDNLAVDESPSDYITSRIRGLEDDDTIKAILLEVDSYGGSGVAGEEIAAALKNTKKPTVALIRDGGASAAYWAATGADKIYASKLSDVGGIGVTYSYLDNIGKNKKDGLTYNQLSSGKFKDTGDPDKPLSLEERQLIMRDINIAHQVFIKAVSDNRKIGIEKVASLADGSTMLGEAALSNGLIDEIGGMPEVKQYLKEKIGEDATFCW